MSSPNPALVAAAPALIAIIQAAQTLVANLGTDPAQIAVKAPGALQVFLGTVEMQLPAIAASEIGVINTDVMTKTNAWINYLKSLA